MNKRANNIKSLKPKGTITIEIFTKWTEYFSFLIKKLLKKNKLFYIFILITFVSFPQNSYCQNKIDSLKIELENAVDTIRVNLLNELSKEYLRTDIPEEYNYAQEALDLAKELNYKYGMFESLKFLSVSNCNQNKFSESLAFALQALELTRELGDQIGEATLLSNIGLIYFQQDNFPKALDYYLKAFTITELTGDQPIISHILNSIGLIYYRQKNNSEALDYFLRALVIVENSDNKGTEILILNNIGSVYFAQDKLPEALEYYKRELKITEDINDRRMMSRCLNNIGDIYSENKNYSDAIKYYLRSIKIKEEIEDHYYISSTLNGIGNAYYEMGDYEKALEYSLKSYNLAKKIGTKLIIRNSCENLFIIYAELKIFRKAFEYQSLYILYNDSVFTEESSKQIAEIQTKYETEKKEKEIARLESNATLQSLELNKQKNFRNFGIISSFFILVVAILIYIGYQRKKKINKLLSEKNEQIQLFSGQLSDMNVKLEKKVLARTEDLRKTNLHLQQEFEDRKGINIKLVKAKEKAEESDRLKSAFLTNMSHEIRTPMNGILGFMSLLKEPQYTAKEQKEFIRIIEKSGARMLTTIHDIIDISKIESGLIRVSFSEINLNELMDELFEFFLPEARNKNIQFSITNRVLNHQATIKSDKEKLHSILSNLIKNAIKFTHTGNIEFGCSLTEKDNKYELEYYIKDTGIGIPKKRQKAIFNRFVQADIDDIQVFEGSGLGLAISKAYVEMLGGEIWVESDEGVGSQFYFIVPYNVINNEIPKKNIESLNKQQSTIRKLKILVVEDEDYITTYLSYILKEYMKEMLVAKTGIEAVDICSSNLDIDLILMDIKIPEIDGFETTRRIRKFNKDVFILAQTAFAQSEYLEKCIEAGCNDYIAKPINKDRLLEIISNHFYN